MSQPCRAAKFVRIEGHPELSLLFIHPSDEDLQRSLESWVWLDIEALTPIAVSAFGDVFFENAQGVFMLDTIEGKLTHVAPDVANLIVMLQAEEARDNVLLGGLVIGARNRGLMLDSGECYDFKVAPVLGGPIEVDAMQKLSFVVKLHIAGQIHEQVRRMAPGTRITGFSLSEG